MREKTNPISKNLLVALVALPMAMGIASTSRAGDLVDPPVFASSNGVLDLLMIAQPGVVKGLTVGGFIPTGWFYTVCRRPAEGNTCPTIRAPSAPTADSGSRCNLATI